MDKVKKPNNSEYKPSSEPFSIYFFISSSYKIIFTAETKETCCVVGCDAV